MKYTIRNEWPDQSSALEYLITKILLPADQSNIFFNQMRSSKHYIMLSASLFYLETLYQDTLRNKYKLKNLNFYFRVKNWREETLYGPNNAAYALDVHSLMKGLTQDKQIKNN